jgi:hypothetical protein
MPAGGVAARNRRSFPIVKVGAAGFPLYSPPAGTEQTFEGAMDRIGAAIAAVLAPLSVAESDDRCLAGGTDSCFR